MNNITMKHAIRVEALGPGQINTSKITIVKWLGVSLKPIITLINFKARHIAIVYIEIYVNFNYMIISHQVIYMCLPSEIYWVHMNAKQRDL